MAKSVTIPTEFNPADLPEWVQEDPALVERARTDYAWRAAASTYDPATTENGAMRNVLTNEAHGRGTTTRR